MECDTEQEIKQNNCKHMYEIKYICKDDGMGLKLVIGICTKCGKLRYDVI